MLRIKQNRLLCFGVIILGVFLLGMPSVYAEDRPSVNEWVGSADEAVDSEATDEAGTEQLGDLYEDLVYTPVTPCKIVDTRIAGGALYAGQTRSYLVYGNTGAQGGSYCASPVGTPVAVHISMAAVTPSGSGVLKAFPSGDTSFRGLTVNFAPGRDLNNAGTVKTNYVSSGRIGVGARYGGTHVTIQVLGYYKEPEATPVQESVNTVVISVAAGVSKEGFSYCPSGYTVTGGGGHWNTIYSALHLNSSRPFSNGWSVMVSNLGATARNFNVHAVCTRIPGR